MFKHVRHFISSASSNGERQSSGDEFGHACHSAMHCLLFRRRSSCYMRQALLWRTCGEYMCGEEFSDTVVGPNIERSAVKNCDMIICVVSFQLHVQCRAVQNMGRKTQNEKFTSLHEFVWVGCALLARILYCWQIHYYISAA